MKDGKPRTKYDPKHTAVSFFLCGLQGFFSPGAAELRHSLSPSTDVNLDNEILFLSCLLSPHIQALKLENYMHTRTQA